MLYGARVIIKELEGKRFRIALDGEDLSFSYPKTAAPYTVAEARERLREHKESVAAYLKSQLQAGKQRLVEALAQKHQELARRKRDLASPHYANDEWTKGQITYLEGHIGELERYLAEGEELNLPRCCKDSTHICLIAVRGFDSCIMFPSDCGFCLKL